MGVMGPIDQAIMRRVEKTRPCTSGATLACQMAWLQPLIIGAKKEKEKLATNQTGTVWPAPSNACPSRLEKNQPSSTPWTRRFGPPQALIANAPTTPPIAPA